MAHRLAFLYMTGSYPTFEVDHFDRNKSNNAFDNLKDVTHKDNMKNVIKVKSLLQEALERLELIKLLSK